MTKERLVDLALAELNAKFQALVVYAEHNFPDIDSDDWAISKMQNDLENLKKLTNKDIHFDNNYTRTWGYNLYGMYESYDEVAEVAEIISAGF